MHIAFPFQKLSRLINDKHEELRIKVRNTLNKYNNDMNLITNSNNMTSDDVQPLYVGGVAKKKSKKTKRKSKRSKRKSKRSLKKKGSK